MVAGGRVGHIINLDTIPVWDDTTCVGGEIAPGRESESGGGAARAVAPLPDLRLGERAGFVAGHAGADEIVEKADRGVAPALLDPWYSRKTFLRDLRRNTR